MILSFGHRRDRWPDSRPWIGRERRRSAFTLIEVTVVIGIIALLATLLVAAALSSREAARRSQCGMNLKQIGLGISQYSSTHGVLPLAYGGGGNGISFLVAILPYVEQSALYNLIDMRRPPPGTVLEASLAIYLCPSDGLVRTNPLGGTNYAGNEGTGVQAHGYNGTFALRRSISYADFADGTSSTVAVSEWLRGNNTGAVRDSERSVFLTTMSYPSGNQLDLFSATCSALDTASAPLSPVTIGSPWTHGDLGHSLYNHVMTPNRNTCLNGSAHQTGAWTAKSRHAQGVNTLFADGHTTWIRTTIEPSVWRAMGSRNGGELIQSGAF